MVELAEWASATGPARQEGHHTFILSEAANSAHTLVESQRRSQCHTFINYILSQTTWSRDSRTTASQMWKGQFSRGPSFKEIRGDRTVQLLTLQHYNWVSSLVFSNDRNRIVSSSKSEAPRRAQSS